MPAIESAHALAGALKLGRRLAPTDGRPPLILVSLSGRGDKDVDTAIAWFDLDTQGTGSQSGAEISADQPGPGTSGPDDLEIGGHSTGAGHEV